MHTQHDTTDIGQTATPNRLDSFSSSTVFRMTCLFLHFFLEFSDYSVSIFRSFHSTRHSTTELIPQLPFGSVFVGTKEGERKTAHLHHENGTIVRAFIADCMQDDENNPLWRTQFLVIMLTEA